MEPQLFRNSHQTYLHFANQSPFITLLPIFYFILFICFFFWGGGGENCGCFLSNLSPLIAIFDKCRNRPRYNALSNFTISFHRNPIDYLLVNLAVADIIYTTSSLAGVVLGHTNGHPGGVSGKVFCIAQGTIAWVGAFSSVLTLVAIATERYFSVIYYVGGKGKFTMRRLKVCCSFNTQQ